MKKIAGFLLILVSLSFSQKSTHPAKTYQKIHQEAIVVDTHNDVAMRMVEGEDISVLTSLEKGHSDLPRFQKGGIDLQFFSIWVDPKWLPKNPNDPDSSFWQANRMIDALEALQKRSPDRFQLVTNSRDALHAIQSGKLAGMIGVEGAHAIEGDLQKLAALAKRGMRYLTITWNNSNALGSSADDEANHGETRRISAASQAVPGGNADSLRHKGLTELGKQAIRMMDQLGVIVDISHTGEQTFWDILKITKNPIIASHSCVWSLNPMFRNLKDEQIKAIARSGGVIMINFFPGFLDSTYWNQIQAAQKRFAPQNDSLTKEHTPFQTRMALFNKLYGIDIQKVTPPLSRIVDHIDYIVKLVGVDYVGFGADLDGITATPVGFQDVTDMPKLTEELLKRGYPEKDVKKILGENMLRVIKKVCR